MKSTFNGCSRSDINVTPSNWHTTRASVRKKWRIYYRFYDPKYRGTPLWGKQIPIKGMNEFHTLEERQAITRGLIENEERLLDVEAWHPIDRVYMQVDVRQDVSADTPWIKALHHALSRKKVSPRHLRHLTDHLFYFEKSAAELRSERKPLRDVIAKDIMDVLDNIEKVYQKSKARAKGASLKWTDGVYNSYRKHIGSLFTQLRAEQLVLFNPVDSIPIRDVLPAERYIPTSEERKKIDEFLQTKRPALYRFMQIFYHSSSRESELLRLKYEDVDLEKQEFTIVTTKGGKKSKARRLTKPIKDVAVEFWKAAMQDCQPGQYLFGKRLKPGTTHLSEDQIARRWKRAVKDTLGIDVDFYTLKHMHVTEVSDHIAGLDQVADQVKDLTGHTTTAMVVKIYDKGYERRRQEKIKKIANRFAP